MCIDPPGQRLQRKAVCSCGMYYPLCDIDEALKHIKPPKDGVRNHTWVYIHKDWIELLNPVRPPSA